MESCSAGMRRTEASGKRKGFWAIRVCANWRVIFRFGDREVMDVDYLDDH
ncbi:MAG TPA: type II toxin-antitoxin system RelE/ParE family toxin [Candidatus Nitrosotenuis sp.]|nr:type II toxin-antitoxin system RelE/ParE family toxin [Candidatus Nitrosotenuis sp.]